MGQKVNPHGLRVGIIKDWDSRWYADKKDFADFLIEDNQIRSYLKKKLYESGISSIEIERASNDRIKLTINTSRPGKVIGKGGKGVETIRKDVEGMVSKRVSINVEEVKRPELDAQLVAENIAHQLESRISFRRAMRQAIQRGLRFGGKGIKTSVSGRVGGADMARTEGYTEGTIPLQTLRADIDYGFAEADTTYGKLGVKVWIYKGEVLPGAKLVKEETERPERTEKRDMRKERNK